MKLRLVTDVIINDEDWFAQEGWGYIEDCEAELKSLLETGGFVWVESSGWSRSDGLAGGVFYLTAEEQQDMEED